MVPDSIEREVILPVPPARVWAALTRPDQLSAWFGTQATIDLRPGGEVIFTWDGSTGPRGTNRGVVTTHLPMTPAVSDSKARATGRTGKVSNCVA